MKSISICAILLCVAIVYCTSCKKPHNDSNNNNNKNTTDTLSAFALSLKAQCTTPFVGNGDSSKILLPTAFTPNGDGINDIYTICGKGIYQPGYFTHFKLSVYDTLGNLVYNTDTCIRQLWEGVDMNTGQLTTKYKFYVKVNYTTAENITDSAGTYLFVLNSNAPRTCVYEVPSDSSKYIFPDQYNSVGDSFILHSPSSETYCN